jgi:hypothetical protein
MLKFYKQNKSFGKKIRVKEIINIQPLFISALLVILFCLETEAQTLNNDGDRKNEPKSAMFGVVFKETDSANGIKISRNFPFFYFPAIYKIPKNISGENAMTDDKNIFIQTFPRLNRQNLQPIPRFLGGDS